MGYVSAPMAPPLLHLRDIRLSFGGNPLLEGAELTLAPRERLSLVGRNGTGKSTLLKVAAGLQTADDGERFLQPGTSARYLPQEPDLTGYETVLDYAADGAPAHKAERLLFDLGLTGSENPASLSGGEARRAALARVLAAEPDILLLDEPTNHLDLPAIEWLEKTLLSLRSALILISHDRRFLQNLSTATLWLSNGQTRRMDQGFAAFEAWRDTILEQEELERHKLDRKIVREEDWLRYGVTARRKRNQKRLGDLNQLRQDRRDQRRGIGTAVLRQSEADASGKLVAEFIDVSKSYGDQPIVRDLSLRLMRGDRLALIGPNGSGKTTLLRLLTGELAADSGTVRIGASLARVVLDQRRDSLDARKTLQETLTGGSGDKVTVNGATRHVASYMKDFLFQPEQARTPVERLSGGERARLLLAVALLQPSNLLVLDEPTNDLDMETLDLLQDLIGDYQGTVLLVSHDRDFLDRVATSVVASEGDGNWLEYAGGYSDMVAQRGVGVEARAVASKSKPARSPDVPAVKTDAKPSRMTFKDKHLLETLPATMERLQAAIARAQKDMADPNLFARDRTAFDKASAALDQAARELAAAEEQWLDLEMRREEIEG